MNKKLGALLLASATILSLAACGSKESADATPEPTPDATVEATVEPTVKATVEPSAEPTVEASVEPSAEVVATAEVPATAEPTPTAKADPTPAPTPEPTPTPAPKTYKDGTYTASAQGFGGDVTATVTISDDVITSVSISGGSETPEIGGAALDKLAANAKAKGAAMDGVSGATLTSNGAKEAVASALAKAKN